MIRHIPSQTAVNITPDAAWTYCGRKVHVSRCIDLRRDNIESAECKSCQRSDDRRVRESMCGKRSEYGICTRLPGHAGHCDVPL